jgi:cardiolipin synthase
MPLQAVMSSNFLRFFRLFIFSYFISSFSTSSFADQTLIIEPDMGREPLLQAITQARSSVDMVMYGLTDLAFVDALRDAQNHGKVVRVLLQHYPYKADDENLKAIKQLQADKIHLVWPDGDFKLTHQKTFLVDRQTAIVMTFNLTHSTFKNERNFALVIHDDPLTQEIQQVFDADWQHKPIKPQQPRLIWSPDNSREKLLALIRSAKSSIRIYAEGLNDYETVGALAKAARNGVKVEILTSLPRNNDRPSKKWDYLRNAGVIIGYDQEYMIHAKVIMVDHEQAVLGSINLTRASINDNRELSVLTREPNVIKQLEAVFERDWQHTTTKTDKTTATLISTSNKPEVDVKVLIRQIDELTRIVKAEYRHSHKKSAKHKRRKTSNIQTAW